MPLDISSVTAHFREEYLEIRAGPVQCCEKEAGGDILPKIISMVAMKVRAKLFFVMPD